MNEYINSLLKSTKIATEELNKSLSLLDNLMSETLKKAPQEDKDKIEELKNKSEKIIRFAKLGDTNSINEILKSMQNG